jgi:signal transduction histidine kinase/CheY-like chemotaxis protein
LLALLEDQPEQQQQVRAAWARGLAGEEAMIVEKFGDPARDRPYYEIKFRNLFDGAGKRIGAYQFVTDVTERLRREAQLADAQEALRQSQKMDAIGQLTGGVAHDFNNLLTPIVGALDMLQRNGVGSERDQRLIDGAAQSAERAKTLVQRLLAFARRQPLQPISVDIAKLVTGMADLIRSTSGPQIKVVLEARENLPPAKADPNQIEMAVLNLSVNARDAMSQGGTLRITAGEVEVGRGHPAKLRPGRYIRLSVADTGVGMDEATLARAVEPFFSTKGVGKGTGLGLSMAHGLASQLGGALTVQSRSGVGTNVELWLPVSEDAVKSRDGLVESASMRTAAGTALLVDDEELVRTSTAEMLRALGYEVVEAESGEEALRLVGDGLRPDLLVTDHLMPGIDGTDLARMVLSERPEVQILIVSGYAECDGIAPDLPRLTKPFRCDELQTSLARLRSPGFE